MNEYLSAETQYEFAKFNGVVPQSTEATERLQAVPLQKELIDLLTKAAVPFVEIQ